MDLDRLGAPESAHLLRNFYEEFSGIHTPESLFDHYCAYHAYVRSKIACLRAEQHQDAIVEAKSLQLHALQYLERSRVQLIIVGGLPGTGKSTRSRLISEQIGAVAVRPDDLRHEIAQPKDRSGHPPAYRQVDYSPFATYRPCSIEQE